MGPALPRGAAVSSFFFRVTRAPRVPPLAQPRARPGHGPGRRRASWRPGPGLPHLDGHAIASGSTGGCTRCWPITSTRDGSSSSCWTTCPSETWNAEHLHPGARAWRYLQYDQYLVSEVLPFTASSNSNPYVIATGASLGGVLRGLPRVPASAPGEPDPRDERDLRHQAAHRRLLGPQRLRLQSLRLPPARARPRPAGGVPPAGHHSRHRPRRPGLRTTTRTCPPPSGARGSATPCASGTAGRTIGRTGSR